MCFAVIDDDIEEDELDKLAALVEEEQTTAKLPLGGTPSSQSHAPLGVMNENEVKEEEDEEESDEDEDDDEEDNSSALQGLMLSFNFGTFVSEYISICFINISNCLNYN